MGRNPQHDDSTVDHDHYDNANDGKGADTDYDSVLSDESKKVLSSGMKAPERVGLYKATELTLHGDSTITNDSREGNEIRYCGFYGSHTKTVSMYVKKYKVEVHVELLDVSDGWDSEEILRSENYEYKSIGWAFRRVVKESATDLQEHDISIQVQ